MLKAKNCMLMVLILLFVPCIVLAKSANSRTSSVQSTVQAENTDAVKDIFTGVTVYTVDDDEDEEAAFEVALLDAKRDAVEQAGTYIEITTNMINYKITTDDVKVLSATVVKLIPGSINQQVVSEKDGAKTIRLEAKYHVDTKHLEQGLFPGRVKDLQLSVTQDQQLKRIMISSIYNVFKSQSHHIDVALYFSIGYDLKFHPNRFCFGTFAFRQGEDEIPIIMSDKHPVKLLSYKNGSVQEVTFINPNYENGPNSVMRVYSLESIKTFVKLSEGDKVFLQLYQKDGKTYEIVVPRKVLNQWHDIMFNPQKVVAEYEE